MGPFGSEIGRKKIDEGLLKKTHTHTHTYSKFAPENRPKSKRKNSIPTLNFQVQTCWIRFREGMGPHFHLENESSAPRKL